MNLFLLLHALGLGHELHGRAPPADRHRVRPVRLPRPRRADLRPLLRRSRFVVVGTPAGITLAPEGGAHQSTITPSIGLELPGLTYAEPASPAPSTGCCATGCAGWPSPTAGRLYLRLSTRPIDQAPFVARRRARRRRRLRADVLAGGYRLREPVGGPADVVLAACGPVVPEVLAAAAVLRRGGRAGAGARHHVSPTGSTGDGERLASGPRRRARRRRPPPRGAAQPAERRAADRHGPRRRQPSPRLAGRRVRGTRSCRSASTSSVSRAASPSCTASSTCCPSRSSTPRSVALS